MNLDQATLLRQLAQRRPSAGASPSAAPLVVVGGGTRGVGSTTVAVNLAIALARQGRRAVLIDADLANGGHLKFGLPRGAGSIVDVLAGRSSIHEVLGRGPAGAQVVLGAIGNEALARSATAQDRFLSQLESLAPHADALVLDVGNVRTPLVDRLWQAAHTVWHVATPNEAAVLACYQDLKASQALGVSGRQLTYVNDAAQEEAAAEVHTRLAQACEKFLKRAVVAAGSCLRQELAPHHHDRSFAVGSAAARGFDGAAEQLWASLQPAARAPRPHLN